MFALPLPRKPILNTPILILATDHYQQPYVPPSTFHIVGHLLPDIDGPFNLDCDLPLCIASDSTSPAGADTSAANPLNNSAAIATVPLPFWQSPAGHAVILSSPHSKLPDWLSSNFKNLYSPLANKSNESVYRFYLSQNKGYLGSDGPKFAAQVMCTALTVYFNSVNTTPAAIKRGFKGDLGARLINVLHHGHAFNVPNHSPLSILTALQAVDTHTTGGLIHLPLRNIYHDFFININVEPPV